MLYINIDAEIVYFICKEELEKLENYIKEIKKEIK